MSFCAPDKSQESEHGDYSTALQFEGSSTSTTPKNASPTESAMSTPLNGAESKSSLGSRPQALASGWQARLGIFDANAVNWAVSKIRAAMDDDSPSTQSSGDTHWRRRISGSDLYCRQAFFCEASLRADKITLLARIEEVACMMRTGIIECIEESGFEDGIRRLPDRYFESIEWLARLAERLLYPGQPEEWFYRGWWLKTGDNLRAMNGVLDERRIRELLRWLLYCRSRAKAQLDDWDRERQEKQDGNSVADRERIDSIRSENSCVDHWEVVDQEEVARTPSVFPVRTRRYQG